MALLVPDASEVVLLSYMLNKSSPTNVELRLYRNDKTPGESDVLGGYTQATAAGYTAVKLTGSGWTVSTTLGTTTAQFSQKTFSFTTSATIYGYYVTNDAVSSLLWAERFTGAPFSIPSGGGSISITSRISLE